MKNLEIIMNTTLDASPSHTFDPQCLDIGPVDKGDIAPAARILSEAFARYPIATYMFEGLGDGPERFRVMFEYLINSRIVRKWPVLAARIEGRIAGVAVISEPGEEFSTPELDAQWDQACAAMGEQAMERFLKYADACDEGVPSWPHHYLGILGVAPDYQGLGLGGRLVEATKREATIHPTSQGVCLNTEAERNLGFYEKHGLEIIDTRPVDSIRTWCMAWRSE